MQLKVFTKVGHFKIMLNILCFQLYVSLINENKIFSIKLIKNLKLFETPKFFVRIFVGELKLVLFK